MKVEKIEIDKLVHDPSNARKHGQKNLDAIKGSLARFGQQKPIVVNMENVVVAGNGTLDAAKSLGWTEINIVRTDLKGSDITAYAIADNRTGELAEWDMDVLPDLLLSLQEEDFDLASIGFDEDDLGLFLEDSNGSSEGENIYTKKIEPPIYEITGENPELKDLYNQEKMRKLIEKIDGATNITLEQKEFLRVAATRHTVFNYSLIAEYYAHGNKELKDLMEDSGLVIIDLNKAIENGFVQLSKDFVENYISEGNIQDEQE